MVTRWLARLGCGLAVTGLVMELASGFGYTHGWWGLRVALRYLFAYGGIVAAVGCVAALVAFLLARGARSSGALPAGVGTVLGLVPTLLFIHQYRLARSVPPINDISTDLQNPPPAAGTAPRSTCGPSPVSAGVTWAPTRPGSARSSRRCGAQPPADPRGDDTLTSPALRLLKPPESP